MANAFRWSDLELLEELGAGQSGTVWLAKVKRDFDELPSGSLVAVKRYKTWVLDNNGQFERIVRELETGRKIRHPNLINIIAIVGDSSGRPNLIMTYYAGDTLETRLQDARTRATVIEPETAFQIVYGLASALMALHNAGIIHRDVKPSNVILSKVGPILTDLGVVRSDHFPEQTTAGTFLGTIRYAAPEYLFGKVYDSRVDIYSLGAIIFELFNPELFLGRWKNWAELVAEKAHSHQGEVDYASLNRLYGINRSTFIRDLIEMSLTKLVDRTLTLDNLLYAIDNRFWENPYYIAQGLFVQGEPMVRPLGDWTSQSTLVHLSGVMSELELRLSKSDRKYLREIVASDFCYYDNVQLGETERTQRLLQAGAIRFQQHEHGSDPWFVYHPSVLMAFRYGYL